MIELLKKDWRINRVPVVGSLALVSLSYLLSIVGSFFHHMPIGRDMIFQSMALSAAIASVIMVLMMAVFGATAFAAERQDRSADFLAVLPVSRRKIVLSKAIVGLSFPAVLYLMNLAMAFACLNLSAMPTAGIQVKWEAALGMMLFGIAWLASTILSSPAIAVSISIGITFGSLTIGFWALEQLTRLEQSHQNASALTAMIVGLVRHLDVNFDLEHVVLNGTLVVGIGAFLIGTIYYLRRVAP